MCMFEVLHATLHTFTAIVTADAEVALIARHVRIYRQTRSPDSTGTATTTASCLDTPE